MAYITTERVAEIRKELKSAFPTFKFSVTRKHYSTVDVAILAADIDLLQCENDGKTYAAVNNYWIGENYKDRPEIKAALLKISDIVNNGNFDNSDSQTDYFHVGYYVDISIGRYDKPFVYNAPKSAPATVEVVEVPTVEEVAQIVEEIAPSVEIAEPEQVEQEPAQKECFVGLTINTDNAKFVVTKVKEPGAANSLQAYKQTAYHAFYWSSFRPERRAEMTISEHENILAEDLKSIPESYQAKYISKFKGYFSAWLSAQSRCASAAVTGPANFPVARMQKNYDREHAKYQEFTKWRKKVKAMIERSERKKNALPELEQAQRNLASRKANHERMKAVNAIIRKHTGKETLIHELQKLTKWSDADCREILRPDWCGRVGYPQFELTNNLAQIKRLEDRVKELQAKDELRQKQETEGVKDCEINGARIQSDATDDRLKIYFDGKPESNVIAALKRNGFRWSPYLKCWCRKLTRQAQLTAKSICERELKAA